MVALVGLGAFGNVWLLTSMSQAQAVVAAARSIERGAVIEREALMSVQVGTDPALRTVPATELEALVGQRAAVDIVAGSLLTGESSTSENVPAEGYSLVGIALTPAMMPGTTLRAGDRVRVVATPGAQGEPASAAEPHSVAAVVLSRASGTDQAGTGAQTIVTVQVPEADAAALAAMTATGRVALVLDSRDR